MTGCHAEVGLDFFQSHIDTAAAGGGKGLVLDHAELEWLTLGWVTSEGPVRLDDARIVGDLRVSDSTASWLSLVGAQCDRVVVLRRLNVGDYVCVRDLSVRKGLSIADCEVGGELEVTDVRTDGTVEIESNRATTTTID